MSTPLVLIESPYAGKHGALCACPDCKADVEANVIYARAAIRDCLLRGEAPFASHLLYTQPGVLDDMIPAERNRGVEAGLALGDACHKSAVFIDRGYSRGMVYGIDRARQKGRPLEVRALPGYGTPLFPTTLPSKLIASIHFTADPERIITKEGREVRMPLIPWSEQPLMESLAGLIKTVVGVVRDGNWGAGDDWTLVHLEGDSGYQLGVFHGRIAP